MGSPGSPVGPAQPAEWPLGAPGPGEARGEDHITDELGISPDFDEDAERRLPLRAITRELERLEVLYQVVLLRG